METSGRDAKVKPVMDDDMEGEKEAKEEMTEKEEDGGVDKGVNKQLLLPRNGETKRKVHWNDYNGNLLAQVLEFVPSDASDTDDDDADACFCTIM